VKEKKKKQKTDLIPVEAIAGKILLIRKQKVILDRDLADMVSGHCEAIESKLLCFRPCVTKELCDAAKVETRTLKQAVRRNISRFPDDFMFELDDVEIELMVSQSVIPSKKYFGGAKPYVFTEQGVAIC